jgi:hypothetical protein
VRRARAVFTGQERDPETALDYFGARQYAFTSLASIASGRASRPLNGFRSGSDAALQRGRHRRRDAGGFRPDDEVQHAAPESHHIRCTTLTQPGIVDERRIDDLDTHTRDGTHLR